MTKPIPTGTPVEGDMSVALDSRFLNSIVLQAALEKRDSETLPVEIDRIEFHKLLKYENGQTNADCYLMFFKGSDKPLKLAKVNIKRLIRQLGTIGKGWHGKKIELCLEQDRRPDLGGRGPCVRVKSVEGSGVKL